MTRVTPFSPGRKWRCERPNGRSFTFLIVGPGSTPRHKRCRLVEQGPAGRNDPDKVHEYSHAHLKKYAKLIPLDGE